MMTPLTKYEQETIINFNREQKTARIFTYDTGWQNHMEKLGIKPELVNDFGGKGYTIPKNWVRKPLPKRQLSEETKAVLAERMKKIRQNKKS
jgi:hypothetical protein